MQQLSDKLKDEYDSISNHVEIKNSKRKLAEIDILAIKGDMADLFEVKCSHRIIKARHQIRRLRKYIKFSRGFFYCGTSGALLEVL